MLKCSRDWQDKTGAFQRLWILSHMSSSNTTFPKKKRLEVKHFAGCMLIVWGCFAVVMVSIACLN